MKIRALEGDWEKVQEIISTHPKIKGHLENPKSDRSGHDWMAGRLCVEGGITDARMIYQIILNNPQGKAKDRKNPQRYIEDIVCKCFIQNHPIPLPILD